MQSLFRSMRSNHVLYSSFSTSKSNPREGNYRGFKYIRLARGVLIILQLRVCLLLARRGITEWVRQAWSDRQSSFLAGSMKIHEDPWRLVNHQKPNIYPGRVESCWDSRRIGFSACVQDAVPWESTRYWQVPLVWGPRYGRLVACELARSLPLSTRSGICNGEYA